MERTDCSGRAWPSRSVTHLLLGLVVVVAAACGQGEIQDEVAPTLTATPLGAEDGAVAASPTPSPAASATPDPSPQPSPSPTERTPTDADRARFVNRYQPDAAVDLDSVASDLDGDGVRELVFVYVGDGRVRVDVAWWQGTTYEVLATAEGAAAERIEDLRVTDLNGDGFVEIATLQSSASRSSATLWQVTPEERLSPLVAEGGCWDGSFTYGIVGVELIDPNGDGSLEIRATCDESPLPVSSWRTETYEWREGAYRPVPADTGDAGTGTENGGASDGGQTDSGTPAQPADEAEDQS